MATATDFNRRRSHDELRRRDREMIPRLLVRAMFLMVVAALALVGFARLTDRPLVAAPPEGVEVITERVVVLAGDMAGRATVTDMDGNLIADLPGDKGGFVAGIWRVLQRERMLRKMPDNLPVRLTLYADNRLVVYDDFTGWRAQLIGFGIDNYRTFYNLLDAPVIEAADAAGTAAAAPVVAQAAAD